MLVCQQNPSFNTKVAALQATSADTPNDVQSIHEKKLKLITHISINFR